MTVRNLLSKYTRIGLELIIIVLFTNTNGIDPQIDQNHRENVPNCGIMPILASNRMVKSEEAKVHYPWVIACLLYTSPSPRDS